MARAGLSSLTRLGPVVSARMTGSSLAAPSAIGWVTDFLDAAYYARSAQERDVDDLRLALAVLTTRWHRLDRRLGARDLRSFHRAFGRDRLRAAARRASPVLDRAALLDGGERLLGAGFADGYSDPARRAWGIVFASVAERERFLPERRLRRGALRELTPPRRPPTEQRWHTYAAVPVASADALLDLLTVPERWPDGACELGRFTPVRRGGLAGQTFEIDVAIALTPRTPVFTRGYVTATRVLDARSGDAAELGAYLDEVATDMARSGADAGSAPLPEGAEPRAAVELTTHRGHFLGAAISRLIVFERAGEAFIRDIGSWDPLPAHLALAYRAGGHAAQRAFWGDGAPERSMLHQLGAAVGAG